MRATTLLLILIVAGLLTATLTVASLRGAATDKAVHRQAEFRIDINPADTTTLSLLPGIGPAIAQRIIEHRQEKRPFRSVDDLIQVGGVGPRTLEKLRAYAVVGEEMEGYGTEG